MKPWRENIRLSQPLRDTRLIGSRSTQEEFDRLVKEREEIAYEKGRQAGEQALSHQLMEQRRELLELQQGVLESLAQSVPLLLRETEGVLVELAVEAARKWMAAQPVDAPAIEACVREAMDQMDEATEFNIQLNAEDMALLEKQQSPLIPAPNVPARIRLSPSAEVPRGGCIVQTRFGTVDARRESKITRFKQALQA